MPATVAVLHDRQAVRDVLIAAARGADRCDASTLSACFWPDATVRYGGLPAWSREAFTAAWLEAAARCTVTQHLLFNDTIEVDGDVARVETYYLAVFAGAEQATLLPFCGVVGGGRVGFQGGRCVDRCQRRDGRWRIASRIVCGDWFATADGAITEAHRSWNEGIGAGVTPGLGGGSFGGGDLLAREAIRDLVYRFARGVDRADVALLGTVFADIDAERRLIDDLIARRDQRPVHNHYIANLRVDVARRPVAAEASFLAAFVEAGAVHLLGGRHMVDIVDGADGWRIAGRGIAVDWQAHGDSRHVEAFHRATGDKSRRDRGDASYNPEVTGATSGTLEELLEREGVHDALARYARGADRLDRRLLESAFVDAQPQFMAYMFRQADVRPIQNHNWTNLRVQLAGENLAYVEAAYISVHGYVDGATTGFIEGATSADDVNLVAGRYVRWFEKVAGRWGLRNLSAAAVYPPPGGGLGDWHAALDGSGGPAFLAATGNLRHRGDRDDPSYFGET